MEDNRLLAAQIEITISDIDVEDGYYSFNYRVNMNGEEETYNYESDFMGWEDEEWKKVLEEGEAMKQAIEAFGENL